MKIAIVAPSPVPFVIGGAENLWWGLLDALNARPGVQADLLKLSSPERNMGELLASYRRFAALDLSHFDMVISTKYPAWCVRHPNHVVYLQHTLRGLYDCYPAGLPVRFDEDAVRALGVPARIVDALAGYRAFDVEFHDLLDALDAAFQRAPASPLWAFPGPFTRAVIRLLDAVAMRTDKIVHYAAISDVVAARDGYFPAGVDVDVRHHPTNLKGLRPGPQETIFSASRLDPAKRIELIIEAYVKSGVDLPLHIAGSGPDEARLRDVAAGHPGVRFLGRLPDADLAAEYARALCVPFVPRDEDYGLITLEAMLAGKPVIATTDSGGPTELIEHGESGLIVKPDTASLAAAMRQLSDDRAAAARMGAAGREHALGVSWQELAEALIAGGSKARSASAPTVPAAPTIITRRAKPLLGVLNTFPIAPVVSGGRLRLHGLYSRVADRFDVRFVNLAPGDAQREIRPLGEGFSEELVPKCMTFVEEEQRLQNALGASVEDLTAAFHPTSAPRWLEAIGELSRRADLIVCSHPYALPALRTVAPGARFVYEAHNVETDLKRDILGPHEWAIERVMQLEQHATRDAVLVTACSDDDGARLRTLFPRADDAALVTVPNGVDVNATPFRDAAHKRRRRAELGVGRPLALFMGSAHGPNIDAARLIVEAAAQLPGVDFLMLGSVCHIVQTWERPENVGLAGVVSDAEKAGWLDVCDLGLNPVISGSGTNLKLIEYAAAGLTVVSTAFGARGMGLTAGADFVEAKGDAFAQGIEAALRLTESDRASMVARARRCVETTADWSVIAGVYSRALEQVLA